MLFSSWLRNRKLPALARRGRTPMSPRRQATFHPRVRSLEEGAFPFLR